MKKVIPFILIFLVSFVSVDSASHFNDPQTPSAFVQDGHFVLREVRAQRAVSDNFDMGINEEEDHWKMWFHFTVDVTNVKIKMKALDGTNDLDSRESTYTKSSLTNNVVYSMEHKDFPTYVDNMQVTITYTYSGVEYTQILFIYTLGSSDKGSEPLAITTSEIPTEYIDTDGSGTWDSDNAIGSALNSVLQAVKAPFNFLMWISDGNTIVAFVFSFIIMYLSAWAMMRVPIEISGWLFIPFLVGLYFFLSTVLEGVGIITA